MNVPALNANLNFEKEDYKNFPGLRFNTGTRKAPVDRAVSSPGPWGSSWGSSPPWFLLLPHTPCF